MKRGYLNATFLFLLVFGVGLSGWGRNPEGESAGESLRRHLEAGESHYYQLNYTEADRELQVALGVFKSNPDLVFDYGVFLRQIYLMLGVVSCFQGLENKSDDYFFQVLQLDPNYQIDLGSFPPHIVEQFERVRKKTKKSGKIEIESRPKNSPVYLNGMYVGKTPLVVQNLTSGNYAISFQRERYESLREWIPLEEAQSLAVKRKLKKENNPNKNNKTKWILGGLGTLGIGGMLVAIFSQGDPSAPSGGDGSSGTNASGANPSGTGSVIVRFQ